MSTDIKRFVGEDLPLLARKFENLDEVLANLKAADRKEYPMLFSTSMVQAILAGRKTQTRRLRNLEQFNSNPDKWKYACAVKYDPIYHLFEDADGDVIEVKCPYGKPGDILWVRETWTVYFHPNDPPIEPTFVYKADANPRQRFLHKWKPSIHMPREACRLRLQITAIRVERLNDISESDAIAEGIETVNSGTGSMWRGYLKSGKACIDPKTSFQTLWQSINGTGSWYANPWVWVIEFKRLTN